MATADELLATLNDSKVDDGILVIDNNLRTINIPKSITMLGVEADDDVHRLQFRMPRMYGSTDLSEFVIRVNYMNAGKEGDVYVVTDKNVYNSYISFSWLVGPHAFTYKGDVKFIVCLKETDAEGNILREFNTTVATLPVLEGLEVDASIIEGELTDGLEQMLYLLGQEVTKLQANITEKGAEVLASIPEDYTETYNLAHNSVRTRANAVICAADGDIVKISDSSSDYLRGLRVFGKTTQATTTGKNLLNNIATTTTIYGITYTALGNGIIRANGTATEDSFLTIGSVSYKGGTEYRISGCPGGGAMDTYSLYTIFGDGLYSFDTGNCQLFTPAADITKNVSIKITKGATVTNLIFKPMICLSSVSDRTYEPYSGGVASPSPDWPQDFVSTENPTVDIHGKNLLDFVGIIGDGYKNTLNGLTVTVKDGFANVIGTNTKNGFTNILHATTIPSDKRVTLPAGTYTTHPSLRVSVAGKVTNAWANLCGTFTFAEPFTITGFYIAYEAYATVNETVPLMLVVDRVVPTTYDEWKPVQSINIPYTLPGIPVESGGNYTDANGQQWICDEVDFERGVYVRRINTVVCDGTEDITAEERSGGTIRFIIRVANPVRAQQVDRGFCTHFTYSYAPIGLNDVDQAACIWTSGNIYCRYDGVTTANEMANWLSEQNTSGKPLAIKYVLETPIETPLTQEDLENFKMVSSNYPNTTVLNDAGTGMEVKYNADTQIYLDNLPKATDTQVRNSVDAWLTAYFASAEEASF